MEKKMYVSPLMEVATMQPGGCLCESPTTPLGPATPAPGKKEPAF